MPLSVMMTVHANNHAVVELGICLKRDSVVSVMYPEELDPQAPRETAYFDHTALGLDRGAREGMRGNTFGHK
jgi:hypothetical protein